jgi:ribulose-bisphosphate carboxylase small chain
MALSTWGDISFDYESTDTPDVLPTPTPSRSLTCGSPRAPSPTCPTSPTPRSPARSSTHLDQGWALSVEFTDDPHPRNNYWEMWGLPMFDLADPAAAMHEVNACREAYPEHYIKVNAYDARQGPADHRAELHRHRPADEPGFRLDRQEAAGRNIRYTTHAYATDRPARGPLRPAMTDGAHAPRMPRGSRCRCAGSPPPPGTARFPPRTGAARRRRDRRSSGGTSLGRS